MDLELAAVARAGVDLADRQAAAEPRGAPRARRCCASSASAASSARRRRLGQRPAAAGFRSSLRMLVHLEVVARVGAVERLVAEREIGDDVALDRRLEQRPLEPRRVAQVAALDACRRRRSAPTTRMSPRKPSTSATPSPPLRGARAAMPGSARRAAPRRICSISARLCSTSRMRIQTRAFDIALLQHRHLEAQLVVGRDSRASRRASKRAARSRGRRSRRRRTAARARALRTPVPTVRSCSEAVLS